MSEPTGHRYLQSHEIGGDVLSLDLSAESSAILDAARASNVGHAAKTLIKEGPLRIVILGFRAGAALHEHHADGPVSIQLLAGDVTVSVGDQARPLRPGNALVLGASMMHSVEAKADSVVLLTIALAAGPPSSAAGGGAKPLTD